jgi:hypothetical protein
VATIIEAKATRGAASSSPVTVRFVPVSETIGTLEVRIDYNKAPIPEHSYYCDYGHIGKASSGLVMTFGKQGITEKKLRTKLEIAFPHTMFQRQFLQASSALKQAIATVIPEEKSIFDRSLLADPDKVQTFRANNAFIGLWGEDAVIDFYYFSPRESMTSTQRGTADLEPVVRVMMETALLSDFLDQCNELVSQISPAVEVARGVEK